jgi:two-component system chemotaxis response regulator CheY
MLPFCCIVIFWIIQKGYNMKFLIVDDDFTNRLLLQEFLKDYAHIHIAVDGKEAVQAVTSAIEDGEPYRGIFLDIMMPKMNGQDALKEIRKVEQEKGYSQNEKARIVMITALGDQQNIDQSFAAMADGYIVKPVVLDKLTKQLKEIELIP